MVSMFHSIPFYNDSYILCNLPSIMHCLNLVGPIQLVIDRGNCPVTTGERGTLITVGDHDVAFFNRDRRWKYFDMNYVPAASAGDPCPAWFESEFSSKLQVGFT
jgi:hypothetical protein